LQSQFPDVLEELKTNEATRDEIEAMLKEVNDLEEEEYNEEDYEVYPKAVLKEYRDKLKEINAEIKAANKEIGNLTKRIKLSGNDKALQTEKNNLEKQVQELETSRDEIEQKLATHTNYETRLRDAKKVIKEIKDRKEELIAKAREKITPDEAKELILARWKKVLSTTIMAYVADYQRGFLNRLENLFEKYTVTINEILEEREKESAQLAGFLKELGYE